MGERRTLIQELRADLDTSTCAKHFYTSIQGAVFMVLLQSVVLPLEEKTRFEARYAFWKQENKKARAVAVD